MQIAYWLMQNDYRILIAACDTFRSGAVEQLRTHAQHLSSLHPPQREGAPPNIMLYDRGYKKDPSGVAMEAIHFGTYKMNSCSLYLSYLVLLHCTTHM